MNRSISSPRDVAPRRVRRWCALIALAAAFCATDAVPAHADEITRRIQEELRKRNLYFGDVDGRLSPQLSAALHRYQERKGFSSTGETDADTLYSLNIVRPDGTPSPTTASAPVSTVPPALDARDGKSSWPDITVLRSDEARPDAGDRETAAASGGPSVHPTPVFTPAPPPASATVLRRPSVEKVHDYLTRYLQAGQNNDAAGEMRFYGDHVAYYDEGTADHAYILRDVNRYDHRWPERHFTLLDPVTVADSPDGDPDKFVVNFRYGFSVKNSRYAVGGKTDNTWTVSNQDPGDWKIVSMKEQRVREK